MVISTFFQVFLKILSEKSAKKVPQGAFLIIIIAMIKEKIMVNFPCCQILNSASSPIVLMFNFHQQGVNKLKFINKTDSLSYG